MKFDKEKMRLYAITDRHWLNGRSLKEVVKESLDGGVTFLQLRDKNSDDETFLQEATELQELCRDYKVPLIINDNVEIALKMNADGVHVGQSDMEAGAVREKLGPDKILGVSARTVEQALLAQERGADYLGVGAVFATGSKADAAELPHETLKAICEAVSIPVVVLAALGLLRMTERSRMGADAAIAVVSASALAVGVVVTSLTTGMTTDVDSFMFGSILAMDRADVALSVGLCAAVLVLYVLFYHRLFAITFDESFARATGVKVGLYNTILSVLTALTIVLGMRMMGAMLISSLVIFPALTAMTLLRSFRGVVICAAGLSVVCFCVGLTGSYLWGTPVGATVVLVNLAAFLLSRGVMKLKRAS